MFSYWRTTVPEWQEENRRIEALWQSHPRGTTQLVLHGARQAATDASAGPRQFPRAGRRSVARRAGVSASAREARRQRNRQPTRLDFARWLADRRSPTTARSIVNRIWQAYFGTGLVATAEDLGTQGEPPSHPELLDWLAVELMENDWSLKHIHRLIVTSATYRQSSAVTPELLARDPDNRLLARGPRYRVDAEVVRDIALAASGLLNPTRSAARASIRRRRSSCSSRRPATGRRRGSSTPGPTAIAAALYTFRFRSCRIRCCRTSTRPIGEVACARRVAIEHAAAGADDAQRAAVPRMRPRAGTEDRCRTAARATPSDWRTPCGAACRASPKAMKLKVLQEFLDQQQQRFNQRRRRPVAAAGRR